MVMGEEEMGSGFRWRGVASCPTYLRSDRRQRAVVRAGLVSNVNAGTNKTHVGDSPLHCVKQGTCMWGKEKKDCEKPIGSEKLDEWMRESITEVVRNIGEAPFLVHIYSNKGKESTRLEREKADSEHWSHISRRWEEGNATPDGVILVEELNNDEEGADGERANCSTSGGVGGSIGTTMSRLWGIVIQGRGLNCSACYILKTSRVCSSLGFCTHFCLVRAKCFGKAADLQLRDSWLTGQ